MIRRWGSIGKFLKVINLSSKDAANGIDNIGDGQFHTAKAHAQNSGYGGQQNHGDDSKRCEASSFD